MSPPDQIEEEIDPDIPVGAASTVIAEQLEELIELAGDANAIFPSLTNVLENDQDVDQIGKTAEQNLSDAVENLVSLLDRIGQIDSRRDDTVEMVESRVESLDDAVLNLQQTAGSIAKIKGISLQDNLMGVLSSLDPSVSKIAKAASKFAENLAAQLVLPDENGDENDEDNDDETVIEAPEDLKQDALSAINQVNSAAQSAKTSFAGVS